MKNLQRYLYDIANLRRNELLPYIFNVTGARVQTGPFIGSYLIPRYMWGDGDTAAKLLGVYEEELHQFIEHSISKLPDLIINIGSAEGYYSIGYARRLPKSTVIAVDIEPSAASIIRDVAMANDVKNLIILTETVDATWIEEKCKNSNSPLLVMDCEGAEINILDINLSPALSKSSIIVECHDCMNPIITETLIQRFCNTHDIKLANQASKDPYKFEFLKHLSDCDKWALIHEGRPSSMNWLYMTPKL